MVALNKPVSGNTNWYQPVTDNWTTLEASVDQAICEGRLTLSSGNPAYAPQPHTPSSTDTGANTVTFASPHGWTTGTMASVFGTTGLGGLTSGTIYYINAVSSTTVSFHTTLADAEAGTNKVALTSSVTAAVRPSGVSRTTIYFSPYRGNRISLFSGSTWNIRGFSELSKSLVLTSGKNYDLFVYDNSGTPALELSAAWTDDTTRADNLTLQDGIRVKSSDTTRRYVGTIRAAAANTGVDSLTQRFVSNYYNRRPLKLFACPKYTDDNATTTYTSTSTTWEKANSLGGGGGTLEWISNGEDVSRFSYKAHMYNSSISANSRTGIGVDSSTSAVVSSQGNTTARTDVSAVHTDLLSEGYHSVNLLVCVDGGTGTWEADMARKGASDDPYGTYIEGTVMV